MRKFLCLVMLLVFVFTLPSCIVDEEEVDIDDALKVSAWLFNSALDGTGYLTYENYGSGAWQYYDSDKVLDYRHRKQMYVYEPLELNAPRMMMPIGYDPPDDSMQLYNVNFFIEFDGIIEAELSDEGNQNIFMSLKTDTEDEVKVGKMQVLLCPVGKDKPSGTMLILADTLVGCEYYINIKTFKLDGTPVITAKVKLTTVPDEGYPQEETYYEKHNTVTRNVYGNEDERTRLVTIELVSYEYNDLLRLEDEKEVK